VRSTAAEALVSLNDQKDFPARLKPVFAAIYRDAINTGDAAVIGIVAGVLADTTLGYKEVVKDFSFLRAARAKLSLPRDNEAIQPLEAALALFEGRKAPTVKNEFNHPIDWALVKTIARDQKVRIQTTKGDIVVKLLVEEAPGSVANFVSLLQQGYFNKKFFHRVVPNFVIQAGCNRGDGWGSEDYSIRSEFSGRRYTTGSVGFASAGKDTEGTQWFITHSPTPHLDGRYSIFAEVVSGMDVVHAVEVGDQIVRIALVP
jgi:cyclophilin family peptidyl-prolyl cis-trans isomerase